MPHEKLHVLVNCGVCHACCTGWDVCLDDRYDDFDNYKTTTRREKDGSVTTLLQKQDNGDCVHLRRDMGGRGCEKQPHHPHICKTYTCASHVENPDEKERMPDIVLARDRIKRGLTGKD